MSATSRANVSEFLQSAGVTFSASFVGATVRPDNWECDEWRVTFSRAGGWTFKTEYFTGTGHRKQVKAMPQPPFRKNTLAYEAWAKDAFKPQAPHAADVLHSLLLDSTASDQSFNDWCGDMGMDSDSIKAFSTYQACCAIGESLRKLFNRTELEALRDMVQDY